MEIHIREKCADCGGYGRIGHPRWILFFQEHPELSPDTYTGRQATPEEIRAWFEEHGYRYLQFPPREIPCSSCGGSRQIEEWVSVKQLLELLAAQK